MKTVRVVAAVICDSTEKKNKVFATARGYGAYKGWWEFPGGKIEPGETPEKALVREIKEELNTTVSVEEYITTVEYDYPEFHLSMDCFWCRVEEGELMLLEHEAAKWLPLSDLRQVKWLPADVIVIQEIEKLLEKDLLLSDIPSDSSRYKAATLLAFRKMRRFKQQISEEACIRILKEQKRGVLSMIGDGGYPYGIPLDHWYSEEDHKLYFHCAKTGHKTDAITACDKVSYCVMDEGFRKEGEWALNINSVVVFGRICIVEDEDKKREVCTNLCRKFTDDEAYIQKELTNAFPRVSCLELTIEHMTGKLVNES